MERSLKDSSADHEVFVGPYENIRAKVVTAPCIVGPCCRYELPSANSAHVTDESLKLVAYSCKQPTSILDPHPAEQAFLIREETRP